MEQYRPFTTLSQHHLFDMTVVCRDELFNCKVFAAILSDGTKSVRVAYGEGELEVVDVDYWEEIGWIDMYYGEPSPWSALVGPSLDYHFRARKEAGE